MQTVRYNGPTQHKRVLTIGDQAGLGVNDPSGSIMWARANKWTQPVDSLPSEVLKYLATDPAFVFEGEPDVEEEDS